MKSISWFSSSWLIASALVRATLVKSVSNGCCSTARPARRTAFNASVFETAKLASVRRETLLLVGTAAAGGGLAATGGEVGPRGAGGDSCLPYKSLGPR